MAAPLIVVLGPTGSGKSALALDIAESFRGEIVNCDSLQLYRGFDIGTAKSPVEERRGIPHHLFDILEPHQSFTAGDYARVARPVLHEIAGRGSVPIVVGGTGFYVRALLEGLFQGPVRDPALREGLLTRELRRDGFLHRALSRFDATAAERIHPNDKNKTLRALEVCLAAKRPISEMFLDGREPLSGFEACKIVLDPPRPELHYKLNRRCLAMLEGGLIREIALLLVTGISPLSKPFEAIGYKEILSYELGQLTLTEALELMRGDTRRYAKRQMTWFRSESNAHWVTGFGTDSVVRSSVTNMLVNFMKYLERCAEN